MGNTLNLKFFQVKIELDGQITIYGIEDEYLTALGLDNGDKIGMINKIIPTDVESAWKLLQETTIELVITKNIKYAFRHIFDYASPFGSLRDNLHDEQIYDA